MHGLLQLYQMLQLQTIFAYLPVNPMKTALTGGLQKFVWEWELSQSSRRCRQLDTSNGEVPTAWCGTALLQSCTLQAVWTLAALWDSHVLFYLFRKCWMVYSVESVCTAFPIYLSQMRTRDIHQLRCKRSPQFAPKFICGYMNNSCVLPDFKLISNC